jgi:hypothetical protein
MAYDDHRLSRIFDRTDGRCHLCWGSLTYSAYGNTLHTRGWEVEHSRPRALGGTDRLNNLYAAHITCNRRKGALSTRTARVANGYTRAPMSAAAKGTVVARNTIAGGLFGGVVGVLIAAARNARVPPHERVDPMAAFVVAGLAGASIGSQLDPE